ncbi:MULTISPECIES: SDR family NAD(P)-dependent oxidoreductase [Aeromicrobium]|uniref:SDR family NAD(P)-dependent oxidoreductase n=1 Tax=Aeromicrobium yanjiei TaxID=2662028 RepID=A0A5Q2MQM4_9ACTN|nr:MULTISPECIES: SDR family NAD(P)-dependent oxidoreductase [Aeromicrobium]MRK00521.1 SDR family NAD(P)-dependent oxidoreductase [Aeromicrobium sp. S22]QGG42640.1 SDR family NAD(P)-dependent oxidoreductase [Aeromicrobium yanjiei]
MTTGPRVILVTGASSGCGRATALRAADAGDHLVLVARGAGSLEEVAAECRSRGAASAMVVPTDVGDDVAVAACIEQVQQAHPVLDAVIHCAGVVAYGRTEEVPADVFDGVVRTNLTGSINVARHVLPVLRRQEAGTLVVLGSVIGHIGVPSMSPYVLSKWGVRALARQLQLENRDLRDVHIAYVSPGGVDTPIYQQAAAYDGFLGRPPPPVSSPEKVARVALRQLDHPRARTQVNLSNRVMQLGFSGMPALYDLMVGPLFRLAATDRTSPVAPTEGNVLQSREAGNGLTGSLGNPIAGIARNAVALARSVTGRAA